MPGSILVVEDDASAAESIRDALVGAGFLVPETVPSGERAIEAALRLRPSLVLMDVQLDGPIDGIETASVLREKLDVPIVYLTSFVDHATLHRAKQTAPHGYLRKPFGPRELTIAVELALHQHALEKIAAAREQWFSTTLHSIADAVLTVDAAERITFVNAAAERLLGRDRDAVSGRPVADVLRLVDARGAELGALVTQALHQRTVTPLPRDARLGTGSTAIEVEGSIAPMVSPDTATLGAVIALRDVAERRRLERRLLAAERLAAVGTMAAGMRHEINNPLSFVLANVGHALSVLRDAVARGAEVDPEIVSALEDAAHGADRVRNIVDVLRPIAQGDQGTREAVEVATLVDGAVRASAHALRHHAQLVVEEGSTPPLLADRGQMTAALVALLLGAASRVGEGRALDSVIRIRSRSDAMGRATIEVHDDGPVLGDVERARMFDPFAAAGNATAGVELAVAHRTILAHGGEIDVHSGQDEGTTVRVTLPAHKGERADSAPKVAAPVAPVAAGTSSARPRVLVVDDEPAIGRALARILTPQHEVEVEIDARAALKRLAGGDHFDAILCDLMMPAMSGMELYDQLGAVSGALRDRIVFLTGGAFTARSETFLRDVRNPCLSKPFSRAAVVEAVKLVAPRSASPSSPGLDAPPATTSHARES